tara:strand:+ start:519 stop:662 length:144 start_codon:yes stop_codon:yes gene_type:complete
MGLVIILATNEATPQRNYFTNPDILYCQFVHYFALLQLKNQPDTPLE